MKSIALILLLVSAVPLASALILTVPAPECQACSSGYMPTHQQFDKDWNCTVVCQTYWEAWSRYILTTVGSIYITSKSIKFFIAMVRPNWVANGRSTHDE
jgi:hypothetical protein